MGQSYEKAAVSYPMKRIASDSMDKKTIETLDQQGLWNLPTMVMAQPTAQTMSMRGVVKDAVPVQKPIAQFMASLENELGVTPDRLVQALQNLPPGQLQMSPEKTMLQVVKQLGLSGKDEAKALQLYSKMLSQLQMMDGKDKMQFEGAGLANLKGNPEGLQAALQQASGTQAPQSEVLTTQKGEVTSKNKTALKFDGKADGKFEGKNPTAGQAMAQDVSETQSKVVRSPGSSGQDLKSMTYENMSKGQDSKSGFDQSQNGGQFAGANGQNHAAGAATGARAEQASVKDQVKFDLKHDLSAEKVGKTEVQTDSLAQGSLQPIDTKSASNVVAPQSTAAAELRAAESNPKQEAIQSIIHNAQLLASKGGGEMHMTLKPDHLGEIQLKVAMEGNHVNVQMVTERGEVKKLIEQSVHELRHGLAQHDLSMAKLDVSVGDKTAGGFKQGMPDFSQARDFANQFHQQNAKREMFEDLSNLRGGGRSGMGLMNSAGSAQSRMTLASSPGRSSGRLNVMA
jgi:flagellar hook-length control protein FliK